MCMTFMFVSAASGQTKMPYTIMVTDSATLQPLPGVTVLIQSTQNGGQTDASGKLTLEAKKGSILLFRFVGYKDFQYETGDNLNVSIRLSAASKGLNEVVVVAYGSQRKRDITAAVSTIDVSKEEAIPASNASRLLQGEAPGVVAKQTNGRPGEEFEVEIRGLSSLGASSAPLYVIDGLPVGTQVGQSLNSNDIATISILKDASATALYGARGANGVVLITTKKGVKGATKLTLSSTYGIANVPDSRQVKMLTGPQFAEFLKERYIDGQEYYNHTTPTIDQIPADYRYPDSTRYSTNWFKAILHQNSPYSDNNISISNGTDKSSTFASIGYLNQDGALINTYYQRVTSRVNYDGTPNKYIDFGIHFSGAYSRQNIADAESGIFGSNIIEQALLMDPREPIYNPDGTFNSYIGGHDGVFGFPNPVQRLMQTVNKQYNADLVSNVYLDIKPIKDLTIRTNLNGQYDNVSNHSFTPSTIAAFNSPPPTLAGGADNSANSVNIDIDNLIMYTPTFGDHKIELTAGHTFQKQTVNSLGASGSQYPDDLVPYITAATVTTGTSGQAAFSEESYFARMNYSYADKYLLSGSFTREGSSKFGSNNKWGNFPAISLGWRISNESFFPKLPWLSDLKLRASLGITGNNNIGNYTSQATINAANYVLGGKIVPGASVSSFPNTFLGWEQSKQYNYGADISLLNSKINITAEYYRKLTTNMLLSVEVPAASGFTNQITNTGKVQNKGVELGINYHDSFGEFKLTTGFNISFNRNKVLAIDADRNALLTGNFYDGMSISQVGSPIGLFYGFKVLGIYQNQAQINSTPHNVNNIPGTFQYFDGNGDGQISYDDKDMVVIGNPNPKFTWGWNWDLAYKRFDLSVFMNGSYGGQVYDEFENYGTNIDGVFNVIQPVQYRWRSEQNPGKGIWAGSDTYYFTRESNSRFVYDGTYTWIKNITLAYKLPRIKGIFDAKIFVSVDNAFLITKYPGNNPEVDTYNGISPGYDVSVYPVPRTYSVGAKVNF